MIKKSIQALIAESHNRMLGYVGMQSYHYAQLCVKHEVASLLPLEIQYLGRTYRFEEVARAMYGEGEENDDKMYIYPNDMDYLQPLIEAIYKVHPEFKQELLTIDDENENENENESEDVPAFGAQPDNNDEDSSTGSGQTQNNKYYYILLTMPPVNKDQRKIYLDAVDVVHKYVTTKIDAEKVKLTAGVTARCADSSKEDIDECKEAIEKIYDQDKAMADQQKEEKVKEIEEAYQRYLKEHPQDDGGTAGFGNGNTSQKRQPSMPAEHSKHTDDGTSNPPAMPKAPETPKSPLEGLGLGGGQAG